MVCASWYWCLSMGGMLLYVEEAGHLMLSQNELICFGGSESHWFLDVVSVRRIMFLLRLIIFGHSLVGQEQLDQYLSRFPPSWIIDSC